MHSITTVVLAAGLAQALPKPQNFMIPEVIPTGDICDPYNTEHDHPDPHQLYEFEQMTDVLNCNKNTCEITRTSSEGKTTTAAASVSGGGWISAGFEVGEYEEKGQAWTCQGEKGEKMCVFWRQAYTMYGVTEHTLDAQCQSNGEHDITITSPNKGGALGGSEAICAKNEQCGGKGMKYWNNMEGSNGGSTYAGGPVEWPFGDETGLKDDV